MSTGICVTCQINNWLNDLPKYENQHERREKQRLQDREKANKQKQISDIIENTIF